MSLRLELRTPLGLLVNQPVLAINAEDHDGWFGIAPGRADVVAALPPGLLVFRDGEGESFVALAGGLLDLERGRCRVMAREAVVSRDLTAIADLVARRLRERKVRGDVQRDVMSDLVREALRRMIAEVRE